MAVPKYYEGQEFVSDDPSQPTLVYRAGKFYPKSTQPGGDATAADDAAAPLPPGSEIRPRIVMGLGPAVEAQKNMFRQEGWNRPGTNRLGENPLNRNWLASNIALSAENGKKTFFGIDKQSIAKTVGGDDYQSYDQAIKSWEAALLPIISGAAITPSEGERQLRANLPQLGDTPKTLADKARNRAMMTNAAADLAGKPRPFPKVGTWNFQGGASPGPKPSAGKPQASSGGWKVISVE